MCDELYRMTDDHWVRALLRNDLSEDTETSFCYDFFFKETHPFLSLTLWMEGSDKGALDVLLFDNFLAPFSAVNLWLITSFNEWMHQCFQRATCVDDIIALSDKCASRSLLLLYVKYSLVSFQLCKFKWLLCI